MPIKVLIYYKYSLVVNLLLKLINIYYKSQKPFFAPLFEKINSDKMNTSINNFKINIKTKMVLAIAFSMLISTSYAQSASLAESGSTLSHVPIPVAVEVDDFISLSSDIGVGGLQVNLRLKNEDDYKKGISLTMPNHIVVSTNNKFSLLARAANKNFTSTGYSYFPSNVLDIQVKNTDLLGTELNLQNIRGLEINDQTLISNAAPAIKKYLNVEYTISSKNAIDKILGINPGIYTNTIIYTLSTL